MKLLVAAFLILAHSWYAPECCGDGDCKPVSADEVVELSEGRWKHIPSGSIFQRSQVKPSQDGRFHVCIVGENVYCIYIVQGA